MDAVIFVGLQGAGKSSFYKERFFGTHVRISLDLLRTRKREAVLLEACLAMKQSFVVDNTNPTVKERAKYIAAATADCRVIGYYFDVPVAVCLARNAARAGNERVPPVGIYGTRARLAVPTLAEGFQALYRVRIDEDGGWQVEEWGDEARRVGCTDVSLRDDA